MAGLSSRLAEAWAWQSSHEPELDNIERKSLCPSKVMMHQYRLLGKTVVNNLLYTSIEYCFFFTVLDRVFVCLLIGLCVCMPAY